MNEVALAPVLLSCAAMVGGFVRGFSGFGGPMTIIPVLNLFYPPALSIWIMAVVDLTANIYLVPTARRQARASIYVPLTIGTLVTLGLGVYALVLVDEVIMRRIICVAIIVSCCLLMSGWLFRGRLGTGSWVIIGGASGLVLGATLIAVVTTMFLNAASRNVQENRANIIIWAFVTGIAMTVVLSFQDVASSEHLPIMMLLTGIYFVSCIIGTIAQRRFSGSYTRQLTLLLIILVAGGSLAASYKVFG